MIRRVYTDTRLDATGVCAVNVRTAPPCWTVANSAHMDWREMTEDARSVNAKVVIVDY